MPELIAAKYRKARKGHKCNYCCGNIEPGEKYRYYFLKDGDTYSWYSHLHCDFIVNQLYEYIDPLYEGIDDNTFDAGLDNFIKEFICPDCYNYDLELEECGSQVFSPENCLTKVTNYLREHELIEERKDIAQPKSIWNPVIWKVKKRKNYILTLPGEV